MPSPGPGRRPLSIQARGDRMNNDFDLKEELAKLPHLPGVYIMHDASDEIIYVGKAVDLHNRVRSYFRKIVGRGPQIDLMVRQIGRFEYIVTDTELEALVLENNLIKEHRPRFNTMLKDDKTYPFIKVTVGETYPRIFLTRTVKKDKARYFGPYSSSYAVRETIDLLRRIFRIRSCSRQLPASGPQRPCLYYHMKQCDAPCMGKADPQAYRAQVDEAVRFLGGNYEPVCKMLEEKMLAASEQMEFEEAASWRDLLANVRQVTQKQKITSTDGEDKDIIAVAADGREAVVQVFFVRGGKLLGRDHFYVTAGLEETKEQILQSFLEQYYAGTLYIPKELMLDRVIPGQDVLEQWLSGKKGQRVYLRVPKKGTKEKMVEMAAQNAQIVLSHDRERIRREEGRTIGAVREISALLGLPGINRMEAYDISNISGYDSVGSMVVFEKGKPKRSDYRKFRIKTVTGPNDYASMDEVLSRRFAHALSGEEDGFSVLPDVILMDGGRGQVNIALAVLERLGLSIPVCGMVKDDFHRTRGLYFQNRELPIDTRSEGFKLITRIQDEAHRFAITYHRSLRSRDQVHSVLDDIPGIGPARRKALMRAFPSLDAMREAGEEELAKVPSMNAAAAAAVAKALRAQPPMDKQGKE